MNAPHRIPREKLRIDLRCCSCDALLEDMRAQGVVADMVHADPPWRYSKAAPPGHGRATEHYDGLATHDIAATVATSAERAARDAYLALWCTWPLLEDYVLEHAAARPLVPKSAMPHWRHLSGGSWGKTDTRRGIGHHLLGDTELVLVYRKGDPKPQPPGPISNDWRAPRRSHSAKPVEILAKLLRWGTPPDGLVLDLYAGASASLARACLLTGRRYIGAEIDPAKHGLAQTILADCQV